MLENLIHFSESSNQAWTEKKEKEKQQKTQQASVGKTSSNLQPSKSEITIPGAVSIQRTLRSEHQHLLLNISW